MLAFGLGAPRLPELALSLGSTRTLCPRLRVPRAPPPTALAGFGAGTPHDRAASSRKPPAKKQRTIRATYLELVDRGCTEYVCFARPAGGGAGEWQRVGTIVADGDDVCVALSASKRAVLEHAKCLWPKLGLARELEVGYAEDGVGADGVEVCVKMEGECTSAFSPDAVSTPFYVHRTKDGRAAPIDTTSRKGGGVRPGNAFPPRGKGEGKTPGDS